MRRRDIHKLRRSKIDPLLRYLEVGGFQSIHHQSRCSADHSLGVSVRYQTRKVCPGQPTSLPFPYLVGAGLWKFGSSRALASYNCL